MTTFLNELRKNRLAPCGRASNGGGLFWDRSHLSEFPDIAILQGDLAQKLGPSQILEPLTCI